MKRALLLLLTVPFLVVLSGCEMTPEDRDFYGHGWIHPTDLDKERPTQMPEHPETSGSLGGAPVPSNATAGGGGWTPD